MGHMRLSPTPLLVAALAAWTHVAAGGTEPLSASTNSALPKTYRNPLLPDREIADPFVLRLDKRYYLYPTTDAQGIEVFESTDLVHWERKARAFRDPRGGDWAPEVFYDRRGDGKFYLFYTDTMPTWREGPLEKQIGVAVANGPLGPFTDRGVLAKHAIDADLFQDDDGSLYLSYVDLVKGFKIVVQPMATPLEKKGEPKVVIRPTEEWEKRSGEVTEGPFMLKHKGTYYLMYSGTGANSPNYGIGYATSTSPTGPFVKYAGNPIAHRGGKVLGPGHHSVVEGPDGKLWMVYHQKWDAEHNFHRFLAIDPLWFDDQGVIHTRVTRDTEERAP
jgi:xylan 1,4-beta-xylosidase